MSKGKIGLGSIFFSAISIRLTGARIVSRLLLVGPLHWPVLGLDQVTPGARSLVVRPWPRYYQYSCGQY